ncbi:cation:proton antiporter [Candidatus Cyanaurora vandensis]|uniref:cation:proton antiporter domain-containing protein n=1 Tax=Candidatus Cyanaurora vandensis TaxID=2714958 RepID=UPI002580EF25|nr:cation:proton antiporter [Candidatus Cyanaurora vandensis]
MFLPIAATTPGEVNILLLLLIQISIIIALSRGMGLLFKKINQPLVIGEIVAGIMLGPSFFGLLAPDLSAQLFPPVTAPYLNILAQMGLIFFMFLVGLEFNSEHLRGKGQAAMVVSHASIVAPFLLGALLALYLYQSLSNDTVPFISFALFMGAAMSVTAFPVLARILTERNLHKTYLGTIAITCAAVDDVTAWCMLAFVISVVRSGDMLAALPTTLLAVVYIAFMLTVGRMLLNRLADYVEAQQNGKLTQLMVAIIFVGMLVSAMITELIGIHTVFGAFLFGAVMPQRSVFVRDLAEKTEDFTIVFLLPIFFAYTGLRTQFGLLNDGALWLDCALVVFAATLGKFGGSTLAAKLSGLSWREASALGVLMNTRGLMELIILNIGLDLGVISPALFAMMVIMALVTTFATTPVLNWVYPQRLFGEEDALPVATDPTYAILVPVANPDSEQGLVHLAVALARPEGLAARVYPVNLVRLGDEYTYTDLPERVTAMLSQSQERLAVLVAEVQSPILQPISQMSEDITTDLCRLAKQTGADLVLLGWHRPGFVADPLGGKVRRVLETAPTDVAVFVDRGLNLGTGSRLVVPYGGTVHDLLALELALRLALGHGANLTVLQTTPFSRETRDLIAVFQERVNLECIAFNQDPVEGLVEASRRASLLVMGTSPQWGTERHLFGPTPDELITRCQTSLLIVRHHRNATPHLESLLTSTVMPPALVSPR